MMQDEFEEFVVAAGILNDGLAQRELSLIFNLSMITQVDEIEKERHLNAQPLEFMEMFCRLANEASFPPPPKKNEDGEMIESDMSFSERQAQPLSVKIENCLPTVMLNTMDRKYVANFNYPKKDTKKNLYYLPNGKFF